MNASTRGLSRSPGTLYTHATIRYAELFSGGAVPDVDNFAVPDSKFVNMLGNLYLLHSEEDKDSAMSNLRSGSTSFGMTLRKQKNSN